MTSISEYASPRCYRKHQRHARLARTRYSGQLTEFLDTAATSLSLTMAQTYDYLYYNSACLARSSGAWQHESACSGSGIVYRSRPELSLEFGRDS